MASRLVPGTVVGLGFTAGMGGELAACSGVGGSQYRAVARRLDPGAVAGPRAHHGLSGVRERSGVAGL